MIIIIERIPPKTHKQDLMNFVQPALKGHFFQKSGQVAYVKVVTYTNKLTEKVQYYGMILIPSDTVAERVIRKLHKKKLLGSLVIVRKYHLRSWHNDPRISHDKPSAELQNRRKVERRQSALEERKHKVPTKFIGQKGFFRNNF